MHVRLHLVLESAWHSYFSGCIQPRRQPTEQQDLAKKLLRTTDDKIAFIYSHCGFNTTQSMLRSFVKATGMTPSKWREMSE